MFSNVSYFRRQIKRQRHCSVTPVHCILGGVRTLDPARRYPHDIGALYTLRGNYGGDHFFFRLLSLLLSIDKLLSHSLPIHTLHSKSITLSLTRSLARSLSFILSLAHSFSFSLTDALTHPLSFHLSTCFFSFYLWARPAVRYLFRNVITFSARAY